MKVSDKLKKINDSITVNLYDNGYMVEVNGRDYDDDYTQVKIVCTNLAEIAEILSEVNEMERT